MPASLNHTADSPSGSEATSGGLLYRGLAYLAVAMVGAAADLGSKQFVFATYYGDPIGEGEVHRWLISNLLGIQTSINQGALFGIGQGNSLLFAIFSVVALLGILLWLFVFGAARDTWLNLTLGAITGGIIGNLYDRLGLWHGPDPASYEAYGVRDWIHFYVEGVPPFDPWPNFNIADSLLVCGAISLFIHMMWIAPRKEPESQGESESQGGDNQAS